MEEDQDDVEEPTEEPIVESEPKNKEDEPEVVMEIEAKNTDTKAPAKVQEKAPVVVVKELDEKQKSALKSAYKFPNDRCILVHPHPKAKSGKFDCTVMSLSVLLDYRTEDNKESTFEVSLFAELFNEMLMRDSGFKLYKVLVENMDKTETKKPEEAPKDSEDAKKVMKTVDRDLLLSCSYFDLGHCGYFETKDLEDILTCMNLNLSRAQIKKLGKKKNTHFSRN